MRRLLAILSMLPVGLAALGCDDNPVLQKLPEPEVQIDELKQKPAALVDILWVVDNSGSMVEEQAALAANFKSFITGLTVCRGGMGQADLCDFNTKKCVMSGAPCNPPDYHIGVITTDVFTALDQGKLRKVGLCVPSAGSMPAGGKSRYCGGDNRDCNHDAADPFSDPANRVCDMNQSLSFITPVTTNAEGAFSRAVKVGVGGAGLEQGIKAAAMALGRDTNRSNGMFVPAPAQNAGFLRTGDQEASLFIIFVSDEEDSSFGLPSYFYRAFESLKGAGNEGLVSFSAIVGDPDLDGATGPIRGGCPAPPSEATANPGDRYVALSMYSRGLSSEFRVCDDKRLKCAADSACQFPVPGLPGICVPSGACQTSQQCGNFKCGNAGCITCDNAKCNLSANGFNELLKRNGVFGSICEPDYSTVLGALGFEAAGLKRKFGLTKKPDCARRVPCGTTEEGICVKVGEQVIPNDRATGWTYEPGSNSIFFDGDFVPPTAAAVTVSYRPSATGVALSCDTLAK